MMIPGQKHISLYDKKKPKSVRRVKDFLLLSLLTLFILLAIRFANITLIWQLTRLELQHNPLVDIQNYIFMGLSNRDAAQNRLTKFSGIRSPGTAVVSYYTLLNPSCFLISTPGPPIFVDIGRLAVFVRPGITWIQIYPEDVIELEWNQLRHSTFIGSSIGSFLFNGFTSLSTGDDRSKASSEFKISYVENPLEKTKYLKISALIYFFLPMLLIAGLASMYGRGFYSSFLYYFGLFFLFDFKKIFVTVPFFWLFKLADWEISSTISMVVAFCFLVLFLVISLMGILNLKKMEDRCWGKRLIFIFIVMPILIRF